MVITSRRRFGRRTPTSPTYPDTAQPSFSWGPIWQTWSKCPSPYSWVGTTTWSRVSCTRPQLPWEPRAAYQPKYLVVSSCESPIHPPVWCSCTPLGCQPRPSWLDSQVSWAQWSPPFQSTVGALVCLLGPSHNSPTTIPTPRHPVSLFLWPPKIWHCRDHSCGWRGPHSRAVYPHFLGPLFQWISPTYPTTRDAWPHSRPSEKPISRDPYRWPRICHRLA